MIDVKADYIEVGDDGDIDLYNDMVSFISENDMSDPAMYARACELVDMQSCVDYYATEIYIANSDWPQTNKALWRTRGTDGGAYGDGRWRWILFDVNLAMSPKHAESDYIERARGRDPLFDSLLKSPEYLKAFHAKLAELAENNFNPDRVETFIKDYEVFMVDAMENEYARFYNGENTNDDFVGWCDRLLKFYKPRSVYMLENYGYALEQE